VLGAPVLIVGPAPGYVGPGGVMAIPPGAPVGAPDPWEPAPLPAVIPGTPVWAPTPAAPPAPIPCAPATPAARDKMIAPRKYLDIESPLLLVSLVE
jgi:hypothetical protein